MAPLLAWGCERWLPGFEAQVTHSDADTMALRVIAVRPLRVAGAAWIAPGAVLTAHATILHQIVPPVIFYTALCVWPPLRRGRLLLRLVLGIPVSALLITVVTSLQLAGLVEITLQHYAGQLGVVRPESTVLAGLVFMESGGRWLLALIVAALTVYGVDSLCARGNQRKPPG